MTVEQQLAQWAAKKFGLDADRISSVEFENQHETRAWSEITIDEYDYAEVHVRFDDGKFKYFELNMDWTDVIKEVLRG